MTRGHLKKRNRLGGNKQDVVGGAAMPEGTLRTNSGKRMALVSRMALAIGLIVLGLTVAACTKEIVKEVPKEVVVEKEVVKEVPKEVVVEKEVVKEVPVEVVVEKEVVKTVEVEKPVVVVKEVVKEVPKEVVVEKEVVKTVEVEKPVVVEKEVVKIVEVEKPVMVETEVAMTIADLASGIEEGRISVGEQHGLSLGQRYHEIHGPVLGLDCAVCHVTELDTVQTIFTARDVSPTSPGAVDRRSCLGCHRVAGPADPLYGSVGW